MIGRPKFVLASGSPRRLALVNQAGIEPDALQARRRRRDAASGANCRAPAPTGWPAPRPTRRSTSSCSTTNCAAPIILAADTVVAVGRRILPKAELLDEAAQCLRLLSGRNHRVYTVDLPGDAEGGVPPAPGRNPRALQAAVVRGHREPISLPANGAARPAATPRRASPAPSSSRWSAPTAMSSACRSTRP